MIHGIMPDRRTYRSDIQSYCDINTPFILCDDEDDNFMAFIPDRLAGMGSDGALMTYPNRGRFITAVWIHVAHFKGVEQAKGPRAQLIAQKLLNK